jgi:hypothetical protein
MAAYRRSRASLEPSYKGPLAGAPGAAECHIRLWLLRRHSRWASLAQTLRGRFPGLSHDRVRSAGISIGDGLLHQGNWNLSGVAATYS